MRNGSPVQRNDEPLLEKPENINPDFPLTSSVSPCILSDKRDDNHQVFDSDTSTVSDTSTDSDESKQSIALPPPSASKTEISDFYWKMCYGQLSSSTPNQTEIPSGSWSAKRAPPIKSWYVFQNHFHHSLVNSSYSTIVIKLWNLCPLL